MKYKNDWEKAKDKWRSYWIGENKGRPLMCIVARNGKTDEARELLLKSRDADDKHFDADRIDVRFRYFCETHYFLAESFPNVSVDLGPGSMAAYLGCDLSFDNNTVWFKEMVEDWAGYRRLTFDPDSRWFKKHYETFKRVAQLANGDYYIGIPDIMENLDVLVSMRGAQNTIFDIMDEPDEVKKRIAEVQDIYFEYFDRFYDIAKQNENGKDSSCYTVFQVWGEGKTAKLQCDFSAMMSPGQFREFIVPPLREQAKGCDNVLYHLDGPDAIKHMDALMEIDEIHALQWTSGSYNPDGTFEQWFDIYDKAVAAGKALWVNVYSGTPDEWIKRIDKLVHRYGSNRLFLYFSAMDRFTADMLLEHADKNWSDIEGSIRRTK